MIMHLRRTNPSSPSNFIVIPVILLLTLLASSPVWANSPPFANAGPDQTVYLGDTVYLHGSGTDPDGDPIVGWDWVMESKPAGSNAELVNPTYSTSYFIPDLLGDYVLTLSITDGAYWSVPDSLVVHVVQNMPPTAVIVASATTGIAPLTVQFDGTQSSDPEGGVLTYAWQFGDGGFSQDPAPVHTYEHASSFVVALTVWDDRGQEGQDTLLIEVTAPNNPPVASPTATPSSGPAPLTVQFAANASDPEGDPLSYHWDFGDGASSSEANPIHTYLAAGTFVAWLTVSDGTASTSAPLTIVVEPGLNFSVSSAVIKWTGSQQSTMGNIHVIADASPLQPAPADVISLSVDGLQVFSAPFSAFTPDPEAPGVYVLKGDNLLVKLDTVNGQVNAFLHKTNLASIDNSNGLQVEFHVGSAVGVQTCPAAQEPGRKLSYVRQ